MTTAQDPDRPGVPEEPEAVELLPLPERAEAYLAVEQALQERLGLGGP